MKLYLLVFILAFVSACAKDNSPRFNAEEMTQICNTLNVKYSDKTDEQLYYLKLQAKDLLNYYFYDNEKYEKYNALYDEYGLAMDCK